MWSLSYVFATTATAFALMAIVYAVVDVADWWSGAPFYQAGELKWTCGVVSKIVLVSRALKPSRNWNNSLFYSLE